MATKWEYLTMYAEPPSAGLGWSMRAEGRAPQTLGGESLTAELGGEGWELAGVIPPHPEGGLQSLLIFKRPAEGESRRRGVVATGTAD